MTGVPAAADRRHLSLDVIRGVAVMGILLANLPAFALPAAAYFSPLAWGGTGPAEIAAWLATFVFVEGKMRGLFSLLFGASTLLVIDRAQASAQSALRVHLSRMAALFAIGLVHLYLIWHGDILAHYALVGAIAYLFRPLSAPQLLAAALAALIFSVCWNGLALHALIGSAGRDSPQAVAVWNSFAATFGEPPRATLTAEIEAMRGSWGDQIAFRRRDVQGPVTSLLTVGPETLSAMLFGMAAFRSGFLTASWPRRAYHRIAAGGLGVAWLAYLLLGLSTLAHGFDQRWVVFGSLVGSALFRIIGAFGYCALAILLLRPGGRLTQRVAAVGRTAFTNYLGTSVLVTAIFYGWGLGLFAELSRSQIYLVAPFAWLAMLTWSKPWLQRFRYGPLEWLWRSLSRGEPQIMLAQRATERAPGAP